MKDIVCPQNALPLICYWDKLYTIHEKHFSPLHSEHLATMSHQTVVMMKDTAVVLPICLCFNLSSFPLLFVSFTGKVKQEPSVYRDGPPYQQRGSLQLWQFLVTLLDDPANGHFIAWTGRGMEFKLIEPEEVSPRADICYLVNLKSTA